MFSRTSNHIQKFNFIPHLFCEILRSKESCILRFLDQNSRTRFLQACCFGKKYKKIIGTSYCSKKAYLNGLDFCQNPKNLILGTFKPCTPSPLNLFAKIGIRHFSYFMMWNLMERKKKYPTVMIVSPYRHLWCPKCWNQPARNFDVHLQA